MGTVAVVSTEEPTTSTCKENTYISSKFVFLQLAYFPVFMLEIQIDELKGAFQSCFGYFENPVVRQLVFPRAENRTYFVKLAGAVRTGKPSC